MRRYTDHKWHAVASDGRKVEIPQDLYEALAQFLIGRRGRPRHRYGLMSLQYRAGRIAHLEYRVYKAFGERDPVPLPKEISSILDPLPWSNDEDSLPNP